MADDDNTIKINTAGLDSFIRQFPEKVLKAVQVALHQSADTVRNQAKVNSPYITGNLRRSITSVEQKGIALVGTNVEYARVREFSNRKNGKRGYLRPALTDNKKKIEGFFATAINRALQ